MTSPDVRRRLSVLLLLCISPLTVAACALLLGPEEQQELEESPTEEAKDVEEGEPAPKPEETERSYRNPEPEDPRREEPTSRTLKDTLMEGLVLAAVAALLAGSVHLFRRSGHALSIITSLLALVSSGIALYLSMT